MCFGVNKTTYENGVENARSAQRQRQVQEDQPGPSVGATQPNAGLPSRSFYEEKEQAAETAKDSFAAGLNFELYGLTTSRQNAAIAKSEEVIKVLERAGLGGKDVEVLIDAFQQLASEGIAIYRDSRLPYVPASFTRMTLEAARYYYEL